MTQPTLFDTPPKSYHNTTGLHTKELIRSENSCKSQEEKVIKVFGSHAKTFTRDEMRAELIHIGLITDRTPVISIGRALTNLYKQGRLVKLDEMRTGEWGKPQHSYKKT